MKKSQRIRLAALAAKATRTAVEQTEHDSLVALATANPDATKDTEEAAAAESPAAAATPITLGTMVAAAFHSIRGKNPVAADLATANAKITALNGERDAATAQVASITTERDTAQASLTAATAQVNSFAAFFGLKPAELSGKSTVEVSALIQAKVSASAIEEVASMGVPVGQLPSVTKSGEANSKKMAYADFSKLTPGEKMAYCTTGGKITDLPIS